MPLFVTGYRVLFNINIFNKSNICAVVCFVNIERNYIILSYLSYVLKVWVSFKQGSIFGPTMRCATTAEEVKKGIRKFARMEVETKMSKTKYL